MSGDPLADPRAAELLNASCDEIDAAARVFTIIANQIDESLHTVSSVAGLGVWTGSAADAARSSIDSMKFKLQRIGEAYQHGAQAMSTYYGVVSTVQPQFKALKQQIETQLSTISTLNSTFNTQSATLQADQQYKDTFGSLMNKAALKSQNTAITHDSSSLDATSSQLTAAHGTLTTLQASGMTMLQTFSDARHTAVMSINSVAAQAPKESGWDKFLHGAESVVDGGIHLVTSLAVGVAHSAEDLPGDIDNVYNHPGNLSDWGHLAKDTAVVAGATGVVLGTIASGGTLLGADGALAGTLDAVGTTAGYMTTGSEIAGDVNGGTEVAEGHVTDGVVDLGLSNLPDVSNKLGVGDDAAKETGKALQGAESFSKGMSEDGATAPSVYSGLSKADKEGLDSTGQVPLNSESAEQLAATQKRLNAVAENNANLFGRPLDFGIDQTVKEPEGDKLKDTLDDTELGGELNHVGAAG